MLLSNTNSSKVSCLVMNCWLYQLMPHHLNSPLAVPLLPNSGLQLQETQNLWKQVIELLPVGWQWLHNRLGKWGRHWQVLWYTGRYNHGIISAEWSIQENQGVWLPSSVSRQPNRPKHSFNPSYSKWNMLLLLMGIYLFVYFVSFLFHYLSLFFVCTLGGINEVEHKWCDDLLEINSDFRWSALWVTI